MPKEVQVASELLAPFFKAESTFKYAFWEIDPIYRFVLVLNPFGYRDGQIQTSETSGQKREIFPRNCSKIAVPNRFLDGLAF